MVFGQREIAKQNDFSQQNIPAVLFILSSSQQATDSLTCFTTHSPAKITKLNFSLPFLLLSAQCVTQLPTNTLGKA